MSTTSRLIVFLTIVVAVTAARTSEAAESSVFDSAIRPVSNPVFHDLAVTQSYIHPVALYQRHPDQIELASGAKVPMGGNHRVYALALEYAINQKWSIVAAKDGFVDFNPDSTFTQSSGWADIAGGVKWNFYRDEEDALALAAKLMIDIPTGNDDAWQGNGKSSVNPSLGLLKLWDKVQVSATAGATVPFDTDEESSVFYESFHVSFKAHEKFRPLLELNHFQVLSNGDGGRRFDKQVGGGVPGVASFEGGDLINFGASNATKHAAFVTFAAGFRGRLTDDLDCGFAYEMPLTNDETSLMKSRINLDFIFRF